MTKQSQSRKTPPDNWAKSDGVPSLQASRDSFVSARKSQKSKVKAKGCEKKADFA